ncbi:uncharacterized protein LOC135209217 [Macrobrachium nipponense]|uniref:uncharacterized protein LOC135209217 n=1 Tax=Macrobrachium nipponense TaxID=159736 RepID=UPI0030C7FC46
MARFRGLLLLLVLIYATGVRVDAGEKGVFRTSGAAKVSVTLPPEESTSTLLFWAESPNTTVILNTFVQFPYQVDFNVTQTHIWHIAYLYQPASSSSNLSSIVAHSCAKYATFTNDTIKNITISSDKEMHWMFCGNIYACGLQPPSAISSGVPAGYLFEALVGVSALSVLLIVAVVALVVILLRQKEGEHHYEKALWPPIVPPPLPESLNNSLNRSFDANVIKTEGVYNKGRERDSLEVDPPECPPVGQTTWNDVTEDPRASILDYVSVNSVYGMAI